MFPIPDDLVVPIDGLCGSGTSSARRNVAQILGIKNQFDTGVLYRATTLVCLERGLTTSHDCAGVAADLKIRFEVEGHKETVLINGVDRTRDLRDERCSAETPRIAKMREVRETLRQWQLTYPRPLVVDGRDTTQLWSDSFCKIVLVADIEKRTTRRVNDIIRSGKTANYCNTLDAIAARDYEDSNREHSPYKVVPDSFVIDNTDMNEMTTAELIVIICKHMLQKSALPKNLPFQGGARVPEGSVSSRPVDHSPV